MIRSIYEPQITDLVKLKLKFPKKYFQYYNKLIIHLK